MPPILRVRDENGKVIDIPAIVGPPGPQGPPGPAGGALYIDLSNDASHENAYEEALNAYREGRPVFSVYTGSLTAWDGVAYEFDNLILHLNEISDNTPGYENVSFLSSDLNRTVYARLFSDGTLSINVQKTEIPEEVFRATYGQTEAFEIYDALHTDASTAVCVNGHDFYTIGNAEKSSATFYRCVGDQLETVRVDGSTWSIETKTIGGGGGGENGATFYPNVDQNGNLSWTNDGGLENPETVNITGPAGPAGADGQPGAAGKDATINGVNALTIETDGTLTGAQEGDVYTLKVNTTGGLKLSAAYINAGTFAGIVAAMTNVAYTVAQVRSIILNTTDPSGGYNGQVWIKYK